MSVLYKYLHLQKHMPAITGFCNPGKERVRGKANSGDASAQAVRVPAMKQNGKKAKRN